MPLTAGGLPNWVCRRVLPCHTTYFWVLTRGRTGSKLGAMERAYDEYGHPFVRGSIWNGPRKRNHAYIDRHDHERDGERNLTYAYGDEGPSMDELRAAEYKVQRVIPLILDRVALSKKSELSPAEESWNRALAYFFKSEFGQLTPREKDVVRRRLEKQG
jgi:hypothetical protein